VDFEQAKKRLKIAAVLCVLLYGGWWGFTRLMISSVRKQADAEREAAPPALPERIAAADKTGHKDPAAALEAMRAIAAAPRDAEEKALAEQRIPGLLISAHRAAGAAKDWPRQEALWSEIVVSTGDAARRRLISDDRAGWLMRALQENDDASSGRLAAAMVLDTGNDEINPRHALKEWRARQLERWRAARAAKNAAAASAALAAMSSWEPLDSDLPRDIVSAAPPAELLSLAQAALRDNAHAQAAVLLRAVLMARGDRTRADAQVMLDDAIMGLASSPALAQPRADGPPPSVDLYARVDGPRRTEALGLAAAIIEARADELLAGKPHLSGPLYDEAQRRLNEAASRERRPPDEAVAARLSGKSLDARLAATLKLLDTNPENAFAELRPLMRDDKDEVRSQRALEAVVAAWRKARAAKSFDRLTDFSAFLISEVGRPDPEDPFRAEFKSGLSAMAEDAKKEGLNKRVFALSLLADAFPADPEGVVARREAAARGAELARATANRGQPLQSIGNSGLKERSVALVENGTAHHILMLFEGPETFFVRVNPYRRGSVVMKDGKYLIGVATIKDEITPYAVEATLGSVLVRQKFVVVTRGPTGPTQGQFGFTSYGNWTILRAPDGEKFTVSPLNGTVRP
jgi:hypothetical protein